MIKQIRPWVVFLEYVKVENWAQGVYLSHHQLRAEAGTEDAVRSSPPSWAGFASEKQTMLLWKSAPCMFSGRNSRTDVEQGQFYIRKFLFVSMGTGESQVSLQITQHTGT